MTTKGLPRALVSQLNTRLAMEGWENVRQFTLKSGVAKTMSGETVRRAFAAHQEKDFAPITLANILQALNYNPAEIKEIFSRHFPDVDMKQVFIGGAAEAKEVLTMQEAAVLGLYRRFASAARPEVNADLANSLDMIAKIAGVPSTDLTDRLRRGK